MSIYNIIDKEMYTGIWTMAWENIGTPNNSVYVNEELSSWFLYLNYLHALYICTL